MLAAIIRLAPTSPVTAPSVTGSCVPGRDGIPDSTLGRLLCGTWGHDTPTVVWRVLRDRGPLLLAALAVGCLAWWAWRRWVWRRHAAAARWLQIVPPVTASPAATVDLWRLLATVLPAPHRWTLRPTRIVWEVQADPDGMRCGLWLPPGVNPTAVMRVLHRAWPGVRAEQATPPAIPASRPVAGFRLVPTRPDWLPLVDDTTVTTSRRWEAVVPEEDRLRAVYDGLACAGRTGSGLLQVHVSRAPTHRLRHLYRAITHPEHTRRTRGGGSHAVDLLAGALAAVIISGLDLVTPGPSAPKSRTGRSDPFAMELARQARAKYAAGPHLLVAVYATATGPTVAAARAAAADITSGYGLLSAHFTRRRLQATAAAVRRRWVPMSRMSLASVDEVAVLAGLPAEPAGHGLPAAASRRRAAGRDVFRTTTDPGNPRPNPHPTGSTGAAGAAVDPPTVWSVP
jgi:hypothetical protein